MLSLVIPVYRNEGSVTELIAELEKLNGELSRDLEVVFVVDGSPDRSLELLQKALPSAGFRSRLLSLSRNFGSFSAIRAGLAAGSGEYFAVMAADLQEPRHLVVRFREALQTGNYDVAVGSRDARSDPLMNRLTAGTFWWLYRTLVQRTVPRGGVDVFGCTRRFRDEVLSLKERNSTLVGLIFWLGFRRSEVVYQRQQRRHGTSAWSFWRKLRYLLDSCFAFSDLPLRLLSVAGLLGIGLSVVFGIIVLVARLTGSVTVPGYAATILVVMFFGGLNSLGIGILGEYLWRTFENTKLRPEYIVFSNTQFKGNADVGGGNRG